MDLTTAEDSKIVRIACGLALATVCLALCSRLALNHTFVEVRRSVVGGLTVVEKIDSITDNLDRLTMNQRAFLLTGDDRFAVGVAESVMVMSFDLDTLERISTNRALLQSYVAILSHRIDLTLDSIRKSYDLQQHLGAGAAIALLDSDAAADDAKQEAFSLKRAATEGMFDHVQTECRISSILKVLF
jgi:CHASE3 domain sensor protein